MDEDGWRDPGRNDYRNGRTDICSRAYDGERVYFALVSISRTLHTKSGYREYDCKDLHPMFECRYEDDARTESSSLIIPGISSLVAACLGCGSLSSLASLLLLLSLQIALSRLLSFASILLLLLLLVRRMRAMKTGRRIGAIFRNREREGRRQKKSGRRRRCSTSEGLSLFFRACMTKSSSPIRRIALSFSLLHISRMSSSILAKVTSLILKEKHVQ